MNLTAEISPIDGARHSENMGLLQAAQGASNLVLLSQRYPGFFNGNESYDLVPSGATQPRTTFIADMANASMLILIEGMANFDKVPACLAGWADPFPNNARMLYPYEQAGASLVQFAFNAPAAGKWRNIRVVGHSYGGAVAVYLGKYMTDRDDMTDLKIYTYGAPKCGLLPTLPNWLRNSLRRVFLLQDPVPGLPVSSSDMGSLWTLTGVPTARQWSRWANGFSGLTIDQFNQMYASLKPDYQSWGGAIFSLTSWATGVRAFGSDQHTLDAYQRALSSVPLAPRSTPNPTTLRAARETPLPTTLQLQTEQDTALIQAGEVVDANPQGTVVGILTGVPLVRGEIFHGRIVGGKNVVVYNNNIVAWVKTRRLRRSLVRSLNKTVAI